jgi:hypothetical protein
MRITLDAVRDIDAIKDHNYKMLAAAVMYAEAGFFIIPIRPNGKEIPGKRYNFSYAKASRSVNVVRGWYQDGGEFEGWNIGIATGKRDGTFIIDLDIDDQVNGLANFNDIAPEDWNFNGPVQITPSGGYHYFCKWREYATSSTSKLARGVDTRGGFDSKCGGHAVVWPSTINGKSYEWQNGGEVPDTPDWLMEKMGRPLNSSRSSGRGNENLGKSDVEDIFPIEEIRAMLAFINPDELTYGEWLEIGQAIHSQHPNTKGREAWDEWSKPGSRYEPHECWKRWEGFNPGGSIRVGTLIHYAKQRGYLLDGIPEINKDDIDALVDEMNKQYAVVPMGSDILVLEECIVIPELAAIQPKYRFWKKAGFRNYFENKLMITVDTNGKPIKNSHADIWLAHEDRRTYPGGVGLFPNKPQRYHGYFNLWQGLAVEPEKGDWSLFQDHIKEIICRGDQKLYTWILDWMADLVQDPGEPKGTAIVMSGVEGCGKGTFCQMIGKLFGTHYKHLTNDEHLVGRFNGHMVDAVFVFADEAVFGGDRKAAGKLKALVTEKIITGERKGVDAIQYRNCAHVVMASNESWFIPAGPQSRRWLVMDVHDKMANNRPYFNQLHLQMEEYGGLEAMLYDLMNRKITSDLRYAPETRALQAQREQYSTMDSVVEWWIEQLSMGHLQVPSLDTEIGEGEKWPNRVIKTDMLQAYSDWCSKRNRRRVPPNRFYTTMTKAGLIPSRLKINGDRIHGYQIKDHKQCELVAKAQFGYNPQEEMEDED